MGPQTAKEDALSSAIKTAIISGALSNSVDLSTDNIKKSVEKAKEVRKSSGGRWDPPQPSSDSRIWRYLNFTQLQSILERDRLWFSNIEQFNDPYEGTIPKENVEEEVSEIASELDMSQDEAKTLHNSIVSSAESYVSGGYVNCWNINNHESAALWEQYLDSSQGVAICTTVERLENALAVSDRELVFGKVEYINYEREKIPGGELPPIFHKRRSFEHEKEYRVSFTDSEEVEDGKYVDVDTSELIETIYLAPTSKSWFSDLVSEVLGTYDVDCNLEESEIYSNPVF